MDYVRIITGLDGDLPTTVGLGIWDPDIASLLTVS